MNLPEELERNIRTFIYKPNKRKNKKCKAYSLKGKRCCSGIHKEGLCFNHYTLIHKLSKGSFQRLAIEYLLRDYKGNNRRKVTKDGILVCKKVYEKPVFMHSHSTTCRCDYCYIYKFKHFNKHKGVLTFMKFLYFAEKESVGSNTAIKLFNKYRKKIDRHRKICRYFEGTDENMDEERRWVYKFTIPPGS
jgi:hypothetical protein